MELVVPALKYKDSFLAAVEEYQHEQSDQRQDILALDVSSLRQDFSSYLSKLAEESQGKGLPKGYVPQTTYWFVDGNDFIGRVSIRHSLTKSLLQIGGHIGYDIRPSQRKKGYGKKMVALALSKAKMLEITKWLVTCDEDNLGSKKIIEANGGILENSISIKGRKSRTLRYWITL